MINKTQRYTTGQDALTDKEYTKLMSVVDNIEDECLFTLAVSTGLRRFDLTNLQITGLHLEDTQYKFTDNPELVGNWLRFNEKKKGNRIRVIPLNEKSVQCIKKLINSRGKTYKSNNLFSFRRFNASSVDLIFASLTILPFSRYLLYVFSTIIPVGKVFLYSRPRISYS